LFFFVAANYDLVRLHCRYWLSQNILYQGSLTEGEGSVQLTSSSLR
jgi:hypothetical protein